MFDNIVKTFNAFKNNESENPLLDTLHLLDVLSKRSLSDIDSSLLSSINMDLDDLVQKRKEGIPLEYLLGVSPFWGRLFHCSPSTLIPREETELLAKTTLDYINAKQKHEKELKVIDMGTGCGNIAVSLALNSADTRFFASDLNAETVETAQKNVNRYGLQDRVSLFCGDLFSPLKGLDFEGTIDIIVCNPPYIPTSSLKNMSSEIIDHEPKEAFDAGPFGIDFFRRLINDSIMFLKPKGILLFEIGVGQEKLVTRLFKKKEEYSNIEFFDDGEQIRVISAVYSPNK